MVLSQEEMVLYTRGNGALYKRKWCYIQEEMVLYQEHQKSKAMALALLVSFQEQKQSQKH